MKLLLIAMTLLLTCELSHAQTCGRVEYLRNLAVEKWTVVSPDFLTDSDDGLEGDADQFKMEIEEPNIRTSIRKLEEIRGLLLEALGVFQRDRCPNETLWVELHRNLAQVHWQLGDKLHELGDAEAEDYAARVAQLSSMNYERRLSFREPVRRLYEQSADHFCESARYYGLCRNRDGELNRQFCLGRAEDERKIARRFLPNSSSGEGLSNKRRLDQMKSDR